MKPTGITRGCWVVGVVIVGLLGMQRAAGQDPWYHAAWPYRRAVTIPPRPPSRLAGDDVAVATMPTGGLTDPSGADIRVTIQQAAEVPCRVLMLGPGDQVTVAFGLRPGSTRYYVYFGNPGATTPRPLDIKRGVLMEVWKNSGRPVQTLEQVKDRLKDGAELLGRGFRPDIFQGYNPFGPEGRILVVYTGYLICPWSGRYVFSSSSQDASFLLIDEQLVVDNGGLHAPQHDVRRQGSVELQSGLHKLTFYHACDGDDPVAVAAWAPPGQGKIRPIPPSAFAEAAQAAPGPMEEHLKALTADFIPVHAGEVFFDNLYVQRYSFEAQTAGGPERQGQFAWDFGDGQTAAQKKADHVYLVDGEYTVTLKVRTPSGQYVRGNHLAVSRAWDRVTDSKLGNLQQYAAIVAEYDFQTLGDEAIGRACQLFKRTDRPSDIARAAEAMLRRDKVRSLSLLVVLSMYADLLDQAGRSREAAEAMLKGAAMMDVGPLRATLMVEAGRRMLRADPADEQAMSIFQQVVSRFTEPAVASVVRLARIGIGDVWRARGDYDKATAAYQEAGLPPGAQAAMLQGDMARHVEAYVRDKDYQAAQERLEQWGQTNPTDKLGGYWSLLAVRTHLAQSHYEQAVTEADVLLRVNPSSIHAPRLLMLMAEAYERMGRAEQASAALRRLVSEYPESELLPEATAKLKTR